ncbi:MAG UNVERIFIED_CONTAM: hypothetical protein LVR29_32040 [Microcystis novacekii LVE1205-3]|jgi:hypothetical protein
MMANEHQKTFISINRKQFGVTGLARGGAVLSGLTATGGVISDYTDPGPGAIYEHTFLLHQELLQSVH